MVALLRESLNIQEQPETYISLGMARERQGDPKAACQAYKALVEHFPTSALSRIAVQKLASLAGDCP